MKAINKSRLKKIVKAQIAAGAVPAFTAPRSRDVRQAATKLLTKSSPDLAASAKPFNALMAKHMAKGNAALKKARSTAIKNPRVTKSALAKLAADRIKAFKVLAAVDVPGTQYTLLNAPFDISSTAGMPLTSAQIVPSNSSAKFKLHVEDGPDPSNTVNFSYVWVNPSDKYVVMNVHGYIIFHGHCQLGAGGGFFPGDRFYRLQIDGRLDIFDWSQENPVSIPPAFDQSVNVYTTSEDQGRWSEVGAVDAKDIFRGYDLSRELLVVPPHATMGFVMTASFVCGTGDDSSLVDLDFASGNFQLGSPAVLLAIVS